MCEDSLSCFFQTFRGGNYATYFDFFIVSKAQILILGIKKTYKLIIRIRVENSTFYGHFRKKFFFGHFGGLKHHEKPPKSSSNHQIWATCPLGLSKTKNLQKRILTSFLPFLGGVFVLFGPQKMKKG